MVASLSPRVPLLSSPPLSPLSPQRTLILFLSSLSLSLLSLLSHNCPSSSSHISPSLFTSFPLPLLLFPSSFPRPRPAPVHRLLITASLSLSPRIRSGPSRIAVLCPVFIPFAGSGRGDSRHLNVSMQHIHTFPDALKGGYFSCRLALSMP